MRRASSIAAAALAAVAVVAGGIGWARPEEAAVRPAAAGTVFSAPLASSTTPPPDAPDPLRGAPDPLAPTAYQSLPNAPYDGLYHFVRIRYGGGGGGFGFRRRRGGMWAHDFPRGERNFLKIIAETTFVGALVDDSNVLTLDDPEIFKHPVLYIVEVGYWDPTDEEVARLGEYLLKGGFLIVDDFRDERGCCPFLDHLRLQLERAVPGLSLLPIDGTHEIFDSFFRVDPEAVIPPYGPRVPSWFGLFEDNDPSKRMMVIVNYNNDISEYWEFSDYGYYPIDLANEAYKLGVNYVVYALTH